MRWWERVGAWDDGHRMPVDVAVALVAAAFVVPIASDMVGGSGRGLAHLASAGMVVPLAWRRTRPAASSAAIFAVALGPVSYTHLTLPTILRV